MSIIVVDEHACLNNKHVCSFCKRGEKHVVGAAYELRRQDYPEKHYLFRYCASCASVLHRKLGCMSHKQGLYGDRKKEFIE